MEKVDIEVILQRAMEKFPDAKPRIITDNGPQFISRDFKEFIRIAGMTHVKTSPYYPQSNGKIERLDGKPLHYWSLYYVCPRTGLLRLTPRPTNWSDYYRLHHGSATREITIDAVRVVNQHQLCLKIAGVWELVEVRPLPALEYRHLNKQSDVILDRPVANLTEELLRKHYGRAVYAISRRRLSLKELKQYPIPCSISAS